MKKLISYIIAFMLIVIMGEYCIKLSVSQESSKSSPMAPYFSSIGANMLVSHVDCWAKLNIVHSNNIENNLDNFMKLLEKLEVPISREKINCINKLDTITLTCLDQDENLYSFVNMLDAKETYFMFQADYYTEENTRLNKIIKIMQINYNAISYFNHTGLINSYIPHDEQEKLLKTIFDNLDADLIDKFDQDNVISLTGFSTTLDIPAVYYGKQKCNLQAAIRSNKKEEKTYIYLGFPLLLNNY